MRCSGHVPLVGGPGEDTGLAGKTGTEPALHFSITFFGGGESDGGHLFLVAACSSLEPVISYTVALRCKKKPQGFSLCL